LISTEYVLTRRHGVREGNLLLGQRREQRVAVGVAGALAMTWIDQQLEDDEAVRWGLRVLHLVWTGWIVRHNLQQGRK
jgi:hypothetical protein